jgi:hypothetical protein
MNGHARRTSGTDSSGRDSSKVTPTEGATVSHHNNYNSTSNSNSNSSTVHSDKTTKAQSKIMEKELQKVLDILYPSIHFLKVTHVVDCIQRSAAKGGTVKFQCVVVDCIL